MSQPLFPSAARTINTYTSQCQGLTLKDADDQRAGEIDLDVARRVIPNQPDLVEEVTRVSSIGNYSGIAEDFEALGHIENSDPNSLHQRLYQKASEWFNPSGRSEGGRREARMYPQFKAFVYLIALLIWDKRQNLNLPLERYLLPHRMSDIGGDRNSGKRRDITICWYDPDTDVEAECEAFLEYEESKFNRKQNIPSTSQTREEPKPTPGMVKSCSSNRKNPEEPTSETNPESKPASRMAKKRSSKGKNPEVSPSEPDPEPEVDVTQGPFWRCFGVVECKADYSKAQEQAEYGQLGWYASSALEAAFERNTLWGWVVSKTTVRFVLFTHDAAISSEAIDMKDKSGHQIFIDNFIRLCLCSAYRAGFDPTKRWLEDVKVWEVTCFHSAQKPRHKTLAYVNPLPLKIQGSLFGRRTRCHRASLTKGAKKYELVLKESWVELDHDPDNRKMMNTESLPNEVRIFQEINKNRNEFISKCIPMMKVGGSVYINVGISSGSECFSTVENYCGKLDIVTRKCTVQPQQQTSTTTGSGTDNDTPDIKVVNRVQQRILMSPVGESMSSLHSWAHNPEYIEKFGKTDGSELFVDYVVHVFVRHFWTIYDLYTECKVYHRDLSEGNVLVRENNGDPYPLLIDFDHARLCSDTGNDNMRCGMGTVPFMSMLNLAGYSNRLSILDELESFLYFWVWRCTMEFTPPDIIRNRSTTTVPNTAQATSMESSANPYIQRITRFKVTRNLAALARRSKHPVGAVKQPAVRLWAKGEPGGGCLRLKYWHTMNDESFQLILEDLRPELQMFTPLFLELRRILFDWDDKLPSSSSGTNSKKKLTARKTKSRRDESAHGPMKESAVVKAAVDRQPRNVYKSNIPSVIDLFCERLISRAEEADDILDEFAIAVEDFFDDYIVKNGEDSQQ